MSETGFTKGPWKAEPNCFTGDWYVYSDDGILAEMSFASPGEEDANARLIAAAPDLLDVAEMVVEEYYSDEGGDWQSVARAAKAAIARATGSEE